MNTLLAKFKIQPEAESPESKAKPIAVQDPIIDILRDDFEFDDDLLVLMSAQKCASCSECNPG